MKITVLITHSVYECDIFQDLQSDMYGQIYRERYSVFLLCWTLNYVKCYKESVLIVTVLLFSTLCGLIVVGNLVFHVEEKHEERYGLIHHLQKRREKKHEN